MIKLILLPKPAQGMKEKMRQRKFLVLFLDLIIKLVINKHKKPN